MPDAIKDLLYPGTKLHTEPVIEPRPVDTELPRALSLQRCWLELPAVKQRRKALGWNAPIHHHTRVTYQDVRDLPRYCWHKWMLEQIRKEPT